MGNLLIGKWSNDWEIFGKSLFLPQEAFAIMKVHKIYSWVSRFFKSWLLLHPKHLYNFNVLHVFGLVKAIFDNFYFHLFFENSGKLLLHRIREFWHLICSTGSCWSSLIQIKDWFEALFNQININNFLLSKIK